VSSWYPPAARPRPVEGGLKARAKRGAISRTWWSERFIEVLEEIGMGSRLARGRTYARKGQVMSLDLAPGSVTAQVQGSRPRPYRVRIGITAFGKADWARVEQSLADNAWYAAKLLSGEMPDDLENVFTDVGLSLFPSTPREITLDCTCPDSAVPCKHLAATFYLLAQSFDDDPFAILAWRGRERADLLENLRAARTDTPAADRFVHGKPLADCLDSFFDRQAVVRPHTSSVTSATVLLDQLPALTVTVRGKTLTDVLRPAYLALGDNGVE